MDEPGEIAAVIDVGMGEYHRIDGPGIKREDAVPLERFVTVAMVHPTIKKHPFLADMDQVH
jgi:hypothetical protein